MNKGPWKHLFWVDVLLQLLPVHLTNDLCSAEKLLFSLAGWNGEEVDVGGGVDVDPRDDVEGEEDVEGVENSARVGVGGRFLALGLFVSISAGAVGTDWDLDLSIDLSFLLLSARFSSCFPFPSWWWGAFLLIFVPFWGNFAVSAVFVSPVFFA